MVVPKAWASAGQDPAGPGSLGILAFEAAAAMSRLVSLHRSLSDPEVARLRSDTMRSQGVAYLVSTDQSLLLRLACAELLSDLDRSAAAVARFGSRRDDSPLALARDFALLYAGLKTGSADPDRLGLRFTGNGVHKKFAEMERFIRATAKLSEEMEALDELEAAERKMAQRWGRFSGPMPLLIKPEQSPMIGSDSFLLELKSRRQRVRRLKADSLWSRSFEKAARLMALSACALFARICLVFGPFVPGLPPPVFMSDRTRVRFAATVQLRLRLNYPWPHGRCSSSSGPIERRYPAAKDAYPSNSCPIFGGRGADAKTETDRGRVLEATPDTVGAAGLALRYAKVVAAAAKLTRTEAAGRAEDAAAAAEREEIYGMLPAALRSTVRAKLRDWWKDRGPLDGRLAEGWKEAVGRILGWLGPMAEDTLRWQEERNMDRRRRFDTTPRALMIQTLHLSNREKTEAAIAEVLVGLSCACWYEERRRGSSLRF